MGYGSPQMGGAIALENSALRALFAEGSYLASSQGCEFLQLCDLPTASIHVWSKIYCISSVKTFAQLNLNVTDILLTHRHTQELKPLVIMWGSLRFAPTNQPITYSNYRYSLHAYSQIKSVHALS